MPYLSGVYYVTLIVHTFYDGTTPKARAGGCSQALSPVVQVATDPRWGRLAENFGEDPHLVGTVRFFRQKPAFEDSH
jgi:beta-glucosidase